MAPSSRPRRARARRRTIRQSIVALVVAAILPAYALVAVATVYHYRDERDAEVRASVEVARAVATTFDAAVRDLTRTEYAIGLSIAGHGHSPAEVQAQIDAVRADDQLLATLSWAEPSGVISASTDRRLVGRSVSARDYFQDIVRGAPWSVSGVIRSLADGAPVFAIARAIEADGERRGVVVGTVEVDRLSPILGARRDGGATAIFDENGVLVASNPPVPSGGAWLERPRMFGEVYVRDLAAAPEAGGVYQPVAGESRIGAVAQVPSLPGWLVHTSRPLDVAMQPTLRGIRIWATVAFAIALGALGAALLVSRRITAPLGELQAHAASAARGEELAAIERGPVEVVQVSRALSDMSMAISARHRELADATREAERAMRKAVEYGAELDALFATAPVGLVDVEGSGAKPRLNGAAREILGLRGAIESLEDLLRTIRVTHPARGVVRVEDLPLVRALRGEVTRDELLRVESFAGTPGRACWLSVSAAPIHGPAGEIRGAVAAFVDVTATRELQEERETLMQMVSHDLRTPLHVIVGHAQLLRRGRSDAETVARRSEAILASAGRMQRLIQDMVDAARLEAGHLAVHPEPVALSAFVRAWHARLAGAAGTDRVRVALAGEGPIVLADPGRLDQILQNLVTNALKYSAADSEVLVAVAVDGDRAQLSVRDRGPGIPADELPRLFDRYYRARGTLRAEGLGLGLFITRKLVDAHGWDVRVDSVLGRGSTFTVVAPVIPGEPRVRAAEA